jgi:acetaldehyde dehydrogenase (acetylating)
VTLEGTQELMKVRDVSVILATGGMGLVRAAYSAGKPAYGVGPGNAPCYIEQSADLAKAAADIVAGKASTTASCARRPTRWSSIAPWTPKRAPVRGAGGTLPLGIRNRALARAADHAAAACRIPPGREVGRPTSPRRLASRSRRGTRALLVELKGVGRDYPLSIEKLCPVLSYYVVSDWREGCERCKEILRYGGMGHTMSIHSQNEQVILEFGLTSPRTGSRQHARHLGRDWIHHGIWTRR